LKSLESVHWLPSNQPLEFPAKPLVKKIRSWHGECREKSAIFYTASWHLSEPGTLGFTGIHQELAEKKPFFSLEDLAAGRGLGGGAWTSARGGPGYKSPDPGTERERIGLKLGTRPAGFILNPEHLDSPESVKNWPRKSSFSSWRTWRRGVDVGQGGAWNSRA